MKEKVIIFIVGLLLGAILSTGSIYVYTLANNSKEGENKMQMQNEQGGTMNGNQPPEIPNNGNMQ